MLLLLILFGLPCFLSLDLVIASVLLAILFPIVTSGVLSLYLILFHPPAEKGSLAHRIQAARQVMAWGEEAEEAWHQGMRGKGRPWGRLPQWEKEVVCEAGGHPSSEGRRALRRAALHPVRQ
jgi:hypothetical protein